MNMISLKRQAVYQAMLFQEQFCSFLGRTLSQNDPNVSKIQHRKLKTFNSKQTQIRVAFLKIKCSFMFPLNVLSSKVFDKNKCMLSWEICLN